MDKRFWDGLGYGFLFDQIRKMFDYYRKVGDIVVHGETKREREIGTSLDDRNGFVELPKQ